MDGRRNRFLQATRTILSVLLLGTAVAACGGAASTILSDVGAPIGSSTGPTGEQPAAPDRTDTGLLIIKTGSLTLRVTGLDDALATAASKISALGGYVSGSSRTNEGDASSATVTYRIPAAHWDDALASLRGLASKVLGEESRTEEVTGQVLDLGARIHNLQVTEAALQQIMTKATKITDVLAVQAQLTDVRGQIEQLQTQKQHLEEQAAFGTLSVTWQLPATPAVTVAQKKWDPAKDVDQASASLFDVAQSVVSAAIWFAIVGLPTLIVAGVALFLARLAWRRLGRFRRGPGAGSIVPSEPGA